VSRSAFGAFALILALGVAVLASISREPWPARPSKGATLLAVTPVARPSLEPTASASVARSASEQALSSETNLANDGDEEHQVRQIDALVALDRIGEAHSAAMLFIQDHPSGPFSTHVMNLMGVHPRPPGAVPRPRDANGGG
jgi:hypothetical protein